MLQATVDDNLGQNMKKWPKLEIIKPFIDLEIEMTPRNRLLACAHIQWHTRFESF